MKYQSEFNQTDDLGSFVKLVLQHYPKDKINSIKRRYYDLRKTKQRKVYIPEDEFIELTTMKKIMLKDMIRFKTKLTKDFLLKHGFKPYEINYIKYKMNVGVED